MTERNPSPLGAFPPTRWTLVGRAGDPATQVRRRAVGDLVRVYLPALRAHLVIRKRIRPDRVDDLLQSFLSDRVLPQDLIAKAQQDKGKFRTYLLTALDRHIISQRRFDKAQKRSSAEGDIDIDEVLDLTDRSAAAPDSAFTAAWAKTVLKEALNRMKADCDGSQRPDIWQVFEMRMLDPMLNGTPPPSYEVLVEQFKFKSPAQASNLLITAKRKFVAVLRSVVAEYAEDDAAIDAEIADLIAGLGKG